MHILQIASDDFFSTYGGGQVYVKNLVDEMIRQSTAKVSVLSFTKAERIHEKDYHGSTIYETGELTDSDLSNLLTKIAPDVIHAHSHKAQICRVSKSLNMPVIVTAHHGGIVCPAGTLMNCKDEICQVSVSHRNCLKCVLRNIRTGLWWYPLMKDLPESSYVSLGERLARLPFIYFVTPIGQAALSIKGKQEEWQTIINDCSLMIAPSEAIKDAMLRNGFPKAKVTILPHGIPLPEEVSPFLSTKDGIRFFYVGRICYVKGIHILLEAFHQLSDTKAQLHLIGGSGNKEELRYEKKLRKIYKDDKRIIWHGKVPPIQIFNIIKNFHISIVPSICLESFGLNIAESLSMGKPVLATRCGGAEMQVDDGVNGWLVTANDVAAMTAKMEQITSSPDMLATMSLHCHAVSIEEHCKQLIDIYYSKSK